MSGQRTVRKMTLLALVAQVCLYYADLYDLRVAADRRELFVRIIQALGAASSFWRSSTSGFRLGHRARRVHDAAFLVMAARHRVADGIRVDEPARRAARTAAARRHERRRSEPGARDFRAASRAWCRDRRVRRSRPGDDRRIGSESGRHRHDRRHPVDRARAKMSIAWS